MKTIITILTLILATTTAWTAELILPYSTFGPQATAHKLIGMEWWQWESHGNSKKQTYPIKVVVYWDQTLEETKKKYPVDQAKLKDFRYVEYSMAVKHMEEIIPELQKLKLETSTIKASLTKLKKQKEKQSDKKP